MKNKISKIFLLLAGFVIVIVVLNLQTTTKQGVDYNVRTIKIPLYLKILDFFDRHYNYKQLVARITKGIKNDGERAMKIFTWTYENIKEQPLELPIIDDHVWNIIIRGYGKDDQFSDVFSTLCNYAEFRSFYDYVPLADSNTKIILSYVNIEGLWYVFDPYNGVFFVNEKNTYASISEIRNGNWHLEHIGPKKKFIPDYKKYITNIVKLKHIGLRRGDIQSPLRRLLFELHKKQE